MLEWPGMQWKRRLNLAPITLDYDVYDNFNNKISHVEIVSLLCRCGRVASACNSIIFAQGPRERHRASRESK